MRSAAPYSSTDSAKIRDRSYENQRHRASGLNLLVAAIILWNTTYLQRGVDHLRIQGHHPASGDLAQRENGAEIRAPESESAARLNSVKTPENPIA